MNQLSDQISLATRKPFSTAQTLTARFEVNDFERKWNAGRLDNHFLFELHYLRTRGG